LFFDNLVARAYIGSPNSAKLDWIERSKWHRTQRPGRCERKPDRSVRL